MDAKQKTSADHDGRAEAPHDLSRVPLVDVDRFREDGYLLIKCAFEPDQALIIQERLSRAVSKQATCGDLIIPPHAGGLRLYRGELINDPELAELVFDPRLIYIAATLLGGRPSYYGDASIHSGTRLDPRLHRDCPPSSDDSSTEEWASQYPLIRLGLYCQDHSEFVGGLSVVKASHHDPLIRGPLTPILSHPGDIVVWDQRLLHVGHTKLNGQSECEERLAAFISFGRPGPHLSSYLGWMGQTRSWMGDNIVQQRWRETVVSPQCRDMMNNRGVDLYAPCTGYGDPTQRSPH
jgi:hypothetical protein